FYFANFLAYFFEKHASSLKLEEKMSLITLLETKVEDPRRIFDEAIFSFYKVKILCIASLRR
ncbi:MAG: hypothetical protein AAF960_25635, partial [Bacteroidota bacterium]